MIVTTKESLQTPSLQTSTHFLKSEHPLRKNHYKYEDYFNLNRNQGILTDWNSDRNVLATEDFVIALMEGLEKEVGSAAPILLYNIGQEWGKADTVTFKKWFESEYRISLREANPSFLFEAWWWPFVSQGWGNWEIDLSEQKNGFMFVNIFDSVVARTLGDIGKPVCHLYAGLFSGFFSQIVNKELGCIEIQCYAMGETYCKFLLGKQDRVDAATFWQNEGASTKDIEKRLIQGEYLQ